MQPLELTILELKQMYTKQPSVRARVYLEWAIENLEKFSALEKEGAVNTSKKQ